MRLSVFEIECLIRQLEARGLQQQSPLYDEIIDHACCMVEAEMAAGAPFSEALASGLSVFGKNEIKEVQHAILFIYQKSNRMKRFSFLLFFLFISGLFLLYAQERSFVPPVQNPQISSSFGMRHHPVKKVQKMHKGIDYMAPIGTEVQATASGIVEKVQQRSSGYGNHIIIRHNDTFSTLYTQLSEILVQKGDKVKQGAAIGKVGMSGTSTAPHLHYELHKNGEAIDPADYFQP